MSLSKNKHFAPEYVLRQHQRQCASPTLAATLFSPNKATNVFKRQAWLNTQCLLGCFQKRLDDGLLRFLRHHPVSGCTLPAFVTAFMGFFAVVGIALVVRLFR
jgi:hypothetical protein